MRQGTYKDASGFIFYWPSSAGHVAYSYELFVFPFEKTKFLFASSYQLTIASGLGIRASVHFSQVWDLTWCTPIEALWRLSQSLWVHMNVDAGDLEDRVSLVSSIPPVPYVLSTSTYAGFLSPKGIWWKHPILCWIFWGFFLFANSVLGYMYLFLAAAGGYFNDNNWALIMSIGKFH